MLIRKLTIAFAATLAMSGNALAEGVEAYIGGGVTYSDADCDGSASGTVGTAAYTGTLTDCDEEAGYQIHAGADYVSDDGWLLGVEVGYLSTDFESTYRVVAQTSPVTTITGNADYEVSTVFYGVRAGGNFMEDRLTPYVRIGAHSYDAETTVSGTVGSTAVSRSISTDGTELYYGIGIEYDFWKEQGNGLGIRLDYTVYDADTAGDVKVLGLTGQYEFNLGY